MKIDKTTLKNDQAWITFKSDEDEYMGTLHLVSDKFVDEVKRCILPCQDEGEKNGM